MKKEEFNVTQNKVLIGVISGFVSLLVVFKILGSSFNELLTLSLFFLVITIIVGSYVWGDRKAEG